MSEVDDACAVEILEQARDRLKRERDNQREYLEDLIGQARCAELMLSEATVGLAAVEALLAGALYDPGDRIIGKWNEREERLAKLLEVERAPLLEAAMPPLLIDYTDIPAALLEPPAEPEPVEREPVEPAPEPVSPPLPQGRPHPKTPEGASLAAADEGRAFAALKRLADGKSEIQVSLAILSEEANVPRGSILFVLRRLADAGRIEIVPDLSGHGTKKPNTYRFVDAAAPAAPSQAPAVAPPHVPTPSAPAFRAPAKVTAASSLRDRIAHALSGYAGTTSGLASMLDVKELLICQTLTAMEHEGVVVGGPMPEAGRRAQLWTVAKMDGDTAR